MASPGQPVETLLQATEVYLATVLLVEDTLQVRLPDYVSRCGFAFPAASVIVSDVSQPLVDDLFRGEGGDPRR